MFASRHIDTTNETNLLGSGRLHQESLACMLLPLLLAAFILFLDFLLFLQKTRLFLLRLLLSSLLSSGFGSLFKWLFLTALLLLE